MGVKIKDLIEKLQEQQDQEKEVEYLICAKDGEVVAAKIETQAKAMKKVMSMFAG